MGDFSSFGKILIMLGAILILVGAVVLILGKIPFIGKLPGDIFIKGEQGSFYFPIVSCIIISIVFSVIMNLFR